MVAKADHRVNEMRLSEGEEIVGIYGNKNEKNCFSSLGFIVWTPQFD